MSTRSKNIVGDQYGRLTVVEQWIVRNNNNIPQSYCKCECSCGGSWSGLANSIRRGVTRSCGCLNDEVRRSGINRLGKKHSEETKRRISELKSGVPNPEAVRKSAAARIGIPLSDERRLKISDSLKGRTLSEDHRRKISESNKGKRFKRTKRRILTADHRRKLSMSQKAIGIKHHLFKDGKSGERHNSRKIEMASVEYKIWRDAVFRRDNYTCQNCKAAGVRLNADHIKPWLSHPEFRYDINNGRTLCVACHRKTETYGVKTKIQKPS